MAALLLCLVLHAGFARAAHNGYVEWSDGGGDDDDDASARQHHVRGSERAASPGAGEEELRRAAAAFLHGGDASALERVNCSRRYELGSLGSAPPVPRDTSSRSVRAALDALSRASDFLHALERETGPKVKQQQVWYRALVRSMLGREPLVRRAELLTEQLRLQAARINGQVELQELSGDESEWRRAMTQGGRAHVHWSAPYLECERGRLIPHWQLELSLGVFRVNTHTDPELRGVLRVDISLQDVDIDQCSTSGWFSGTHLCNLTSMECEAIPGHGFVLDRYRCQCRKGFYQHSREALNAFSKVAATDPGVEPPAAPVACLPCPDGCPFCRDETPCLVQQDSIPRLTIVSFQSLCVMLDLACMAAVYHFRHNKRIKASGFVLLEAALSGAALLYLPVIVLYFQANILHCILLRWLRLLGFATLYGTVILKLFRVLKMFLSRTAQRIPYMTSCRVLRLLAAILLIVLWFLVAWTWAVFQNREARHGLVEDGMTLEGLQFSMCCLDRWDYMTAVAELLFLFWGVHLCYAVRSVPSAFHEPRYMAVAVYNELLLSAVFHIMRFTLAPGLHPDWMLMLCFVHTHLTVTVTLGLLLVPKFVFTGTHRQEDVATDAYEDEVDMGRSGSYLNSSITSAWSEHSLDPEDIREELKKLYGQLELYKRKKMIANNPHLQKKRNSKKGIGRSLMRRITEIPETVSRQCSREDRDGSEHGSSRGTLQRHPVESSHGGKPREDSLKSKAFSLKRSHSYDHTHEQTGNVNGVPAGQMNNSANELSLLETLMGRRSAKKHVEAQKVKCGESAGSVSLVCKSISAQDLAEEKKPMHLRSSMIQKSLSVIASARERTLGLAGKTHSVEETSKKSIKPRDTRMLLEVEESSESLPKMIISQSVEYTKTPRRMGIMKQQVSGSQPSICSEPGRSKDLYELSEVCPWEMEDLPMLSEGKAQKHVSIAPRESNTIHKSVFKSGKSEVKQRPMAPSPSNCRRSKGKGTKREEGGEKNYVRKPKMLLNQTAQHILPWEFTKGGGTLDRIGRKKSVTPTDEKPRIIFSDISKSTGSLLQPPALMVDICALDFDQPLYPHQDMTSSPTHNSKRGDPKRKRKGSCSSKAKGKNKDDDSQRSKSRERRSSSSKTPERRRFSQTSDSGQSIASALGRRRSLTKDGGSAESKHSEMCRWDAECVPSASTKDRDIHKTPAPAASKLNMAEVCPWDNDDKTFENVV